VLTNPPLDENAWELYNLNDDPTERIDLAKKYPEKLAQLKAEFEEQAKAHHLCPLHHLRRSVCGTNSPHLPAPVVSRSAKGAGTEQYQQQVALPPGFGFTAFSILGRLVLAGLAVRRQSKYSSFPRRLYCVGNGTSKGRSTIFIRVISE
jgi:hypothetical protein